MSAFSVLGDIDLDDISLRFGLAGSVCQDVGQGSDLDSVDTVSVVMDTSGSE